MPQWSPEQAAELAAAVDLEKVELVPAIVRDAESGVVLMLGYQNREALEATFTKGEMVYWSRSRSKIWHKGESSGHVQKLKAAYLDCDNDTILYDVEQLGPGACHTGFYSCFYRQADGKDWKEVGKKTFDPSKVY